MKKFTIKILFLSIMSIMLFSCKGKNIKLDLNNKAEIFNEFPKEEILNFENLIEYKLGIPYRLFPLDSTLIIYNGDRKRRFIFCNYSLNEKTLSNGYLTVGKGPNEVIGAMNSGVIDDNLWVYDISLKKVLITSKTNAVKNNVFSDVKNYEIKDNYTTLTFNNEEEYSAIGNFGSTSKSIVERKNVVSNKKIQEYGEYTNISGNLKLETIRDAYMTLILSKPSKEKIVLGYRHSDLIEIYELNTGKCIAIQGPESYPVDFVEEKASYYYMGKNKDTRKAFISGTVTDNYIYLVYSGNKKKSRSEEDRFNWWYGKYIYVYDWNGNPVKKINLDRQIYSIGVTKDDKTIYSYDLNTGYLLKANLK